MIPQLDASSHPHDGRRPAAPKTLGADIAASLVVFLVALPLCVGVAAASGVPVELGILTGIVGGLVVGVLPGSSLQVSGPAAGLTVLVASAVSEHGLGMLGVIVLGAGVVQILLGATRLGTWFRAISPSVVQGMLAGIGLVLILGQVYPVGGLEQPDSTAEKFGRLGELATAMVTTPQGVAGVGLAVAALLVMTAWKKFVPAPLNLVPGALIAVVLTSAAAALLALPVEEVEVGSLLASLNPPTTTDFGAVDLAVLGSILTFALIASAESLFSAAAVDRMHDGPKTHYNKELVAQGAGNAVCGVFGALPMTAVIVRSSTNVQAGGKTKLSRVLHGFWLLLFVVLLPGLLAFIPTAVLAALLIQAGWKLLELKAVAALVREHRSEAFVLVLTAVTIVATDLLIGTLTGLAAAVVKTAVEVSRLSVEAEHADDHVRVQLGGNATFLRLPRLLDHLERLPEDKHVHLDLSTVRHLDRACHQAVENWVVEHRRNNGSVEVAMPAGTG
ncbi:SulP family inorganic anion transporter [Saccharopolyspora rhizosphaerae]|uniref:SulP family inorganic anion transporter n=1 Tax=Saccharopolyspora rhizosphaerae TaxID=2492662 RepID=A0A426JYQ4_9PSEU|nr:SulP family inorganic anion transporter [Saccharopolyspora rhizosphaerae]RRO18211.1 SulP family inorganic anion transporter [Saccharopolyspora rhizosphaerae]